MKTLTYIAIFFALLFTFNACTKTGYTTEHLDATHAIVKIGQTDSLELVGAAASARRCLALVLWRCCDRASARARHRRGRGSSVV